MRLLLSERRLLALPKKQRLAGLLEASRKYQNVVSERLSEQVLHGLHELLRGFQSAHEEHGELLAHELEQDPDNVYRALLTVMLRLVFLLYAEERGMLSEDATFADHYSIGGLYERLREDAGLYPDTMDDRYGAWAQLLVLFRMVHDGAKSDGMRLPTRRGELFSPSRFPFLEGWHGSGAPQMTQAIKVPFVPDGTVYRVLDKLLVLDGERISYRALDVEQIGSVYETMMGFRLERATGRSVAIKAQKRGGASTAVDLEKLVEVVPAARAKWVRDRTDRKLTANMTKLVRTAESVTDVYAALAKVVDTAATPDLVPRGAMILQPSDERRRSGSHYTPRELTAPIVEKALEPVLERFGNAGVPKPAELLELKICDPAMGSGAFLVEVCRQLAERLLESWQLYGGRLEIPVGEDEVVIARRMVAQKCLYGVDRNPMAVDLAKMSLWLATLAKDEPLTFVDHALRDGDSLVGLTRRQIAAFTWKRGVFQPELGVRVDDAVADAEAWRQMIRDAEPTVSQVELEDMWREAEAAVDDVRFYGDLASEAFFLETKVKAREKRRLAHLAAVQDDDTKAHRERLAEKRQAGPPFAPFHWEVEFPEVFERESPGFDAIVGNPPFGGKNTVAAANAANYLLWLKALHRESHGNADLVAHFFRRAFDLLRDGGTFGLIATNTIGQGDTRSTGLRWICLNGARIYAARTRFEWPDLAAVVVSVVHISKGRWDGARELDGRWVNEITAFLFHRGGHEDPARLEQNAGLSYIGDYVRGMQMSFDDLNDKAMSLSKMRGLLKGGAHNREVIRPFIGGAELNADPEHGHRRYVVSFGLRSERECRMNWPDLMRLLEENLMPVRQALPPTNAANREAARFWWRFGAYRTGLRSAIGQLDRVIAVSQVGQHGAFAFLPTGIVYGHTLVVFPFDTHAAFCALQSRPHEIWARFFGSSMKDDLRYTPSDVFETFPFPHDWTTDAALEAVGRAYYDFRADLMVMNDEGLTKTYNRFHNPDERAAPDIERLRELHTAMDRAVLAAYGWDDIPTGCEFLPEHEGDRDGAPGRQRRCRYRWPNRVGDEVLARLLKLNAERAG